ncbi:MAG TPA: uroporphyrinogen-III C-methyltransferase [Deltaproteobacteria bacterium]|nr:uroporphyrinogen-III C-methyltransferase [Deltaproteobacteria bacterium]
MERIKPDSSSGKVYLIGAGPGDPGLLTIRGKELLAEAEVVVYDRLASPRLLPFASPRAERIYVGKRMGSHIVTQEDINRIIVEKAMEGKCVARLKGGDPFIFGRGGEEAQILAKAGIYFEVVPGVTSGIAVPAYAGIPLTHRAHTASVAFITGHRKLDSKEADIDWEGLAKGIGTLVFLMGMKNLPDIAERLIKYGRSPDTPVAVIRWGTTPLQTSITGNLINIAEKVKEAGLGPPSIIVVGDVVALRDKANWFENLPLLGKRILVTRTREQASDLVRLLERRGAHCLECPTIEVRQPKDLKPLDQAINSLSTFDWVIFSSTNAVRFFFERLFDLDFDLRALGNIRIAVVGAGTAKAISALHLTSDIMPDNFRAEGLLDAFSQIDISGKRILIPRAEKAREILPSRLSELGAEVTLVPTYRTLAPDLKPEVLEVLEQETIDVLTFTSSSTVKNFFQLLPDDLCNRILKQAKVACIGPVTARTAKDFGLKVTVQPDRFTIPSLVSAIEDQFK